MKKKSAPSPSSYRDTKRPTTYNVKVDCSVMEFFDRFMDGKSLSARKQLLAKGVVSAGGKVLKKLDDLILAGQTVVVAPKQDPQFELPESLKIVYEDDWILVVNKAAGLLTIATETEKEHTAFSYLSAYLKFYHKDDKIFIVHRIDRGTSGLLIFAKSERIQRLLRDNWDQVVHSRRYVAVVVGEMENDYGTVSTWIDEDPATLRMFVCRPGSGKRAVTHYNLIKTNGKFSLVELELETGRKNQIRVHMKHIGHVLAGDKKYGSQYDPIGRLCLHAAQIEFEHPMTGRLMSFETPIPREFISIFK